MPAPQSLALQLTLVVGLALLSDPRQELKVLRATPSADAAPTAAVTVTFDRPVAGSLDRAVDARALFAIAGRIGHRGGGRRRGRVSARGCAGRPGQLA